MLTGGVGAVIGAATAKKNTVTTPSQDNIKTSVTHDFKIYINLNILTENEKEKSGIENSDTAVTATIITKIGLTILADTAASPKIKAPTMPIV